jgi:hypothetical protein
LDRRGKIRRRWHVVDITAYGNWITKTRQVAYDSRCGSVDPIESRCVSSATSILILCICILITADAKLRLVILPDRKGSIQLVINLILRIAQSVNRV